MKKAKNQVSGPNGGGGRKKGTSEAETRKKIFPFFRLGEFNTSYIAEKTGVYPDTIRKYSKIFLSEVRDTSSFLEREQEARDELVLFLQEQAKKKADRIEELENTMDQIESKMKPMVAAIINNTEKDLIDIKKDIGGLKMMPLMEDKIEQAITEKYGMMQKQKIASQ